MRETMFTKCGVYREKKLLEEGLAAIKEFKERARKVGVAHEVVGVVHDHQGFVVHALGGKTPHQVGALAEPDIPVVCVGKEE